MALGDEEASPLKLGKPGLTRGPESVAAQGRTRKLCEAAYTQKSTGTGDIGTPVIQIRRHFPAV